MAMRKHSVSIRGHRTSFSLEEDFHAELVAIAQARDVPLARLIARIDADRPPDINLSSALRLFVLRTVRQAAERKG
ncbi:MAG: ribbon-helix-helix domain-containing protein [Nitratireductor sp.]|nr:ribbon-helix-helix domain-containing protein [Nitratireductor sp.]